MNAKIAPIRSSQQIIPHTLKGLAVDFSACVTLTQYLQGPIIMDWRTPTLIIMLPSYARYRRYDPCRDGNQRQHDQDTHCRANLTFPQKVYNRPPSFISFGRQWQPGENHETNRTVIKIVVERANFHRFQDARQTAAQLFFCKIEQTLFFKVEKSSTLTTAW